MLVRMESDATAEVVLFPRAGVAARRWRRFEREYHAWLQTSDGRFAVWLATQGAGGHQTLTYAARSTHAEGHRA